MELPNILQLGLKPYGSYFVVHSVPLAKITTVSVKFQNIGKLHGRQPEQLFRRKAKGTYRSLQLTIRMVEKNCPHCVPGNVLFPVMFLVKVCN